MSESVVQEKVLTVIREALERARQEGFLTLSSLPQITVDFPKREEWGDLSTSVAMVVAKQEKRRPSEVAEWLARYLQEQSSVLERVEIAQPGFLNLTIIPQLWFRVLEEIEQQGMTYGNHRIGEGRRVLVEYVSANPTGPLHMGHGRGAALGHALSRILEAAGYHVEQEFYVNDAGRQMKLLGASVFARYQECLGVLVTFPEDGYRGTYIRTIAEDLIAQHGETLLHRPEDQAHEECARFAYETLLDSIKRDLKAFGIEFTSWSSEADLFSSGKVRQALQILQEKALVIEKDGAWWFRSSQFHDEKDRVVVKQNGDYTYLASDIAYHYDKLKRGFDQLVNIWGADHHGYVPRMKAAVQAFGHSPDQLHVVLVQMVSLLREGQKVEMSKRAGEFVTLSDVIEEVGSDAAKFFFLMRRADTHLDFDLDLAKKQSAENPVYYVQYAHARLASLFRVSRERGFSIPSAGEVDLTVLVQPEEFRLIKYLSSFPGFVLGCAQAYEPHRLTFYLQELAGLLHAFYNKHRVLPSREGESTDSADMQETEESAEPGRRCLDSDVLSLEITTARLVLLRQVQTVIRNGLYLLGVSAPESM